MNSRNSNEGVDICKYGQIVAVNCTNPTKLAMTHVKNFYMKINVLVKQAFELYLINSIDLVF